MRFTLIRMHSCYCSSHFVWENEQNPRTVDHIWYQIYILFELKAREYHIIKIIIFVYIPHNRKGRYTN